MKEFKKIFPNSEILRQGRLTSLNSHILNTNKLSYTTKKSITSQKFHFVLFLCNPLTLFLSMSLYDWWWGNCVRHGRVIYFYRNSYKKKLCKVKNVRVIFFYCKKVTPYKTNVFVLRKWTFLLLAGCRFSNKKPFITHIELF